MVAKFNFFSLRKINSRKEYQDFNKVCQELVILGKDRIVILAISVKLESVSLGLRTKVELRDPSPSNWARNWILLKAKKTCFGRMQFTSQNSPVPMYIQFHHFLVNFHSCATIITISLLFIISRHEYVLELPFQLFLFSMQPGFMRLYNYMLHTSWMILGIVARNNDCSSTTNVLLFPS